MKTLVSVSVFGLVAVPPTPDPSLFGQDPSSLADRLNTQGLVWYPDQNRKSLRALFAATLFGIALIGMAMILASVHATSAPPAAGSSAPVKSDADATTTTAHQSHPRHPHQTRWVGKRQAHAGRKE